MTTRDSQFTGSVPALYDRCLGPMLFVPYARDIADRAAAFRPARILETAAGTGIVTEALAAALPEAEIVATDLNQAMLDIAAARGLPARVSLQAADAQALPFVEGSFDLVVTQFGAMFFPDRVGAYAEARRVLRPGSRFLFNVWDALEHNPVSKLLGDTVAAMFPDDPPGFYRRVPFGYHDTAQIEADLRAAGFSDIAIETVSKISRVDARAAAVGLCEGSPMGAEIEARGGDLAVVADAAAAALAPVDGKEMPMSAHVISAG
ncbi:class I SAM-dependent methyltransferase [Allosphingosinicella sp.]|uniref:class I SAM-dependent methyltransferase n=1 Tax=Allosphingosinicella sp. TaxID=2823234 RepID=UPI003784D556